MRPFVPLFLLMCTLAGCASSATSKPTPTRVPTGQPVAIVATVPMSTPVTARTVKKQGKGKTTGSGNVSHGSKALPTIKPVFNYKTPTPFPASAFTAVLHGKVTDAKSGSPISGALVVVGQLPRHTTRTNAFGQYRITFPAGPDVVVQVTKDGFAGQLAMGRIKKHGSTKVDFKLAPVSPNQPVAPSPPMVFGTK